MKSVFVLALGILLVSEQGVFAKSVSKKSAKRVASTSRKGATRHASSSARRAAATAVKNSAVSTTSSTVSEVEEVEEDEEKTKDACIEAYNNCMEQKTVESLMMYDDLFNDYSDMVSDIYNGMSQPTFRCLYSDDVIAIHTKYYYGSELSAPTEGGMSKKLITTDSIEYQNFLKTNAEQVANKKYSPAFLSDKVIEIAGLKKKPLEQQALELPEVSYKVTALDPIKVYKENRDYCVNPKENTNLQGCRKISDDIINAWKNKSPKIEKSCDDYRLFLTEKKSKSEKETKDLIIGLSNKLSSAIEEYNLKIEADRALEQSETDKKNAEEKKKEAAVAQAAAEAAVKSMQAQNTQKKKDCVKKKVGLGILTLGISNLFVDC